MYKTFTLRLLLINACILVFIAGFTALVDPFMQYRIPSYHTYFVPGGGPQRHINAGIAKNAEYNAIISGSSMTENFIISEVNKVLNLKTVKLSLSGGTAYEHGQIMALALKHQKINTVIFGLDITSFTGHVTSVIHAELPSYLYDDIYLNDIQYLISIYSIKHILKTALFKIAGIGSGVTNLEDAYYWADKSYFSESVMREALNKFKKSKEKQTNQFPHLNYKNMKDNFDVNILPLIESNPDTQFFIYYPPSSILFWFIIKERGELEQMEKFKRYLFTKTSRLNNVKVFDFQSDKSITFNLSNYKDFSHHSSEINSYIIRSMAKDAYLVNEGNIETYISKFTQQINEYDFSLLYN